MSLSHVINFHNDTYDYLYEEFFTKDQWTYLQKLRDLAYTNEFVENNNDDLAKIIRKALEDFKKVIKTTESVVKTQIVRIANRKNTMNTDGRGG